MYLALPTNRIIFKNSNYFTIDSLKAFIHNLFVVGAFFPRDSIEPKCIFSKKEHHPVTKTVQGRHHIRPPQKNCQH